MRGWWKQFQHEVHLHHLFKQEMLLKSDISTASPCVPSFLSCCVQSLLCYLQKVWKSKLSVLIYTKHVMLLFVLWLSESLISQNLSNKRHVKFILLHSPFNFNYFIAPQGKEHQTEQSWRETQVTHTTVETFPSSALTETPRVPLISQRNWECDVPFPSAWRFFGMRKGKYHLPYQALVTMSFYLHFSITASLQLQATSITPKPL